TGRYQPGGDQSLPGVTWTLMRYSSDCSHTLRLTHPRSLESFWLLDCRFYQPNGDAPGAPCVRSCLLLTRRNLEYSIGGIGELIPCLGGALVADIGGDLGDFPQIRDRL